MENSDNLVLAEVVIITIVSTVVIGIELEVGSGGVPEEGRGEERFGESAGEVRGDRVGSDPCPGREL